MTNFSGKLSTKKNLKIKDAIAKKETYPFGKGKETTMSNQINKLLSKAKPVVKLWHSSNTTLVETNP